MKILFFVRRFYPEVGGVETHVWEVSRRLVAMGHRVTIVTEEAGGSQKSLSAEKTAEIPGLMVYRIPVKANEKNKKYLIWQWLWKNKKLIEDAEIVHAHDVFFWYLPFRFLYPSKKVYTTFHGYETVYPPTRGAIRMRKISERLSRGNICVGDFIHTWYGTKPTFVTYGGTNEQRAENVRQREKDALSILFVGRMDGDTGEEKYMELLEMLRQNKIAFEFVGVGEGKLQKKFAKFGQTPGFVTDVSPYIERADMVFASSYLSMLESFAAKKLVIALYDNPLKKDYLRMSPFADYAITEESIEEAFTKIKFFILNPNRLKQTVTAAHAWAVKQTWDQVTDLYLQLWKKK